MEWLETGLAFAVTMMVFSTIVSVIIETGHRILRTREKGLKRLMETFYEDIILPRLSNQLNDHSTKDFIERMTSPRFLPVDDSVTGLKSVIQKITNAKELKSLSTLEFIERLPETDAGCGLVTLAKQNGRSYIETFLKDLASKYEDFGEGATEYFTRRSRLASVLVAISLTFSLNINAIYLFKTFLTNKDARLSMIKQSDVVVASLQKQEAALQQLIKTREGGGDKKTLEEIGNNIQEINKTVKTLSATDIPIGWDTAVWNGVAWEEKNKIKNLTLRYAAYVWLLFWWGGSVLLTGILIGLGGPFWFNTFRKLSVLTGIVRGFQSPVQKEKDRGQILRAKTDQKPNQTPTNILEIFETAAEARVQSDVKV